jgi:hypothetical protein
MSRWYADTPARRTRQLVADALVLAWLLGWLKVADVCRDAVLELKAPGRKLVEAGDGISGQLGRAADGADGLPVVGDEVASPLRAAAGGGRQLADAGRSQQEAVDLLGTGVFLLLFVVPLLVALAVWLPPRLAWAREAHAVRRLVRSGVPLEVFAHRAVAHASLPGLVSQRAALGGWAEGDAAAVESLARWELRRLGLALPPAGQPVSGSTAAG